jgi:ribosome-associated protein
MLPTNNLQQQEDDELEALQELEETEAVEELDELVLLDDEELEELDEADAASVDAALELAYLLVDTVGDKKASDILILDLLGRSVLTDYFLICTAENRRQLDAIATAVWEDAKQKAGVIAMSREGNAESGWILIDFGNLIVHLFSPEQRHYYGLEELWHTARVVLRMQ